MLGATKKVEKDATKRYKQTIAPKESPRSRNFMVIHIHLSITMRLNGLDASINTTQSMLAKVHAAYLRALIMNIVYAF